MGKTKLKIQRLECLKQRQAKYSKRKMGIMKKAKELATLCDVDLALLMFSPSGKPSLFVGQNKDLSSVLEKLSALTVEDREERRAYTIKCLKKMCLKADSEVDPKNLPLDRCDALKMPEGKLDELKKKLAEKRKILRDWENPETINNLAQIKIMEQHLLATLSRIKEKKVQLQKDKKQVEAFQAYRG